MDEARIWKQYGSENRQSIVEFTYVLVLGYNNILKRWMRILFALLCNLEKIVEFDKIITL